MKLLALIPLVVLWATTVTAIGALPEAIDGAIIETWSGFKHVFNKTYKSKTEESIRKAIFEQTLLYIRKNPVQDGARLGINQFSDMTDAEFAAKYLSSTPNHQLLPTASSLNSTLLATLNASSTEALSHQLDWTPWMNPVGNQGKCGAGYAFTTTAVLEAGYRIHKNKKVALSKQQVIDCSSNKFIGPNYHNNGCLNGTTYWGLKYAHDQGLVKEKYYPYNGTNGTCLTRFIVGHHKYRIRHLWKPKRMTDHFLMRTLNTVGPVTVRINADSPMFKNYRSGVIRNAPGNKTGAYHEVVVVGWGLEKKFFKKNVPYWKIRNSWGKSWDEEGYFRVERGHNNLGMLDYVTVASV